MGGIWLPLCFSHPKLAPGQGTMECWIPDLSVPHLQGCREGAKKNKKIHPPVPNSFPTCGLAMSAMQGPKRAPELGRHPQPGMGSGQAQRKRKNLGEKETGGHKAHIQCAPWPSLLLASSVTLSSHTGSSSLLLGHMSHSDLRAFAQLVPHPGTPSVLTLRPIRLDGYLSPLYLSIFKTI